MTGGRDLVHEDHYVRLASVQYVKDCLSFVATLGGKILTIVPSTVGKVVPMASPEEEWEWAVEGLKECQAHAEQVGVRIGLEPLNRFETYFINRADQAVALAKDVGGNCGVTLDIFHMNIEEADWAQAIRDTGDYLVDFHVADNNRMPCGQGAIDWEALVAELVGDRLRRLPDGRVRRRRSTAPRSPAQGDRRRGRGRRQPGHGAVPARPRHRRRARALLRPVRPGLDRPPAPGAVARSRACGRAVPQDPGIALIGTLDTKGAEIAYVRDRLRALGARPGRVDSGILGEADGIEPDVPRERSRAPPGTSSTRSAPRARAARRCS